MNNLTEMDPLHYDFNYPNYDISQQQYMYNVKLEPSQSYAQNYINQFLPQYHTNYQTNERLVENHTSNQTNVNITEDAQTDRQAVATEEVDTKENIELIVNSNSNNRNSNRRSKKKGKTSNYWNKKVEDKNFPFYGCTICNVSFTSIPDLDQHVSMHKGRLTSYDIRVRNQIKRKQKLKELKRLKKMGKKMKVEGKNEEVIIKPEEGYIGTEKASEFEGMKQENVDGNNSALNCNEINVQSEGTLVQSNEVMPNEKIENETAGEMSDATKETSEVDLSNNCDKPLPIANESLPNCNETLPDCNESLPNSNETLPNSNEKLPDCNGKVDKKKKKLKKVEVEDPRLLKLFKCFACHKQFALSYYLKLHVRSHTDEKPYTCAACGQSFITASKLGRHNKRIHLAVKFQCRICYRYFSRFDILTRHFDKAHKDDKIEGEPYDYNAILPYIKELEEQLKEKSEKDKQINEQKYNPSDSLWTDVQIERIDAMSVQKRDSDTNCDNDEMHCADDAIEVKGDQVLIKDDASNVETVVQVKVEVEDNDGMAEDNDGTAEDNDGIHDEHAADNSFSDDDYFPVNTWAATPLMSAAHHDMDSVHHGGKGSKKTKKDFPLKCEMCDKVVNSLSYYKVHLRTHSGEKPYKCYICGRGFITSSKMHRHVMTHEEYQEGVTGGGDEDVVDVKEESELTNKSKLKKVRAVKNGKIKKGKRIKIKSEVGESDIKCENDTNGVKTSRKRPHACIYCHKRFLHLHLLQVHQKTHEGQELILKCTYCLEVLPDEEHLKIHEATHDGPRPYLCTLCGRTYTKRETMMYHRKNHGSDGKAGGKRDFVCDICPKTFNAQCKLQRHLVSHRADKFVLKYECPVCAHMFNTKYHVQMHLSTHQKEGLICEENRSEVLAMVLQNARKIPKQPDGSATLTELMPSDERSRVCNICGQVFQHFYYLEEHLKSHGSKIAIEDLDQSEEKKHVCQICNKGFKLHYYLKLHSFTHTKEKPFSCETCGKGFITKGKLKRHLETHTGLKKYQCHVCYKFFTRPSYLRIHVRTIHGTQDYNFKGFSM